MLFGAVTVKETLALSVSVPSRAAEALQAVGDVLETVAEWVPIVMDGVKTPLFEVTESVTVLPDLASVVLALLEAMVIGESVGAAPSTALMAIELAWPTTVLVFEPLSVTPLAST